MRLLEGRLGKAVKVTWALAGASVLLWIGFCGPLAAVLDPADEGAPSYGPTGPFGAVGVFFFFAALALVPLALLVSLAWLVHELVRKS